MPDANGQFKGISIPDCAYTRSLDEARLVASKLIELDRLADAAPPVNAKRPAGAGLERET